MAERMLLPWRRMWDFLCSCSLQPDLRSMLEQAVLGIPRLIPCDQSAAPVAERVSSQGTLRVSLIASDVPQEALEPYCSYYFYKDEARLRLTPAAHTFQVDWRDRGFGRSEFVQDFIHGLVKIDMSAGIPIFDAESGSGICIIVARTGFAGLTRREEAILLALRPQLAHLYEMHRRLESVPRDSFFEAERAGACRLLSRREAEVAALLCRRVKTPEIAAVLRISPRTVETHVDHIYAKLNIHTRRELVAALLGNKERLRPAPCEAPAPTSRTLPGTRPPVRNQAPPS